MKILALLTALYCAESIAVTSIVCNDVVNFAFDYAIRDYAKQYESNAVSSIEGNDWIWYGDSEGQATVEYNEEAGVYTEAYVNDEPLGSYSGTEYKVSYFYTEGHLYQLIHSDEHTCIVTYDESGVVAYELY